MGVVRLAQFRNIQWTLGLQSGLVEEVLSPFVIRVPHQAHDVAARVEIE